MILSVVIPVYNVRPYLQRCIGSLTNQLPENAEIILIDDGSTDGSSEICDDLAAADNRIRTIHTSNGGAARARNRGLEAARGKYLMMIDADDTIKPDSIGLLIQRMESDRLDLLTFGIDEHTDRDCRATNLTGKPDLIVDGPTYALRYAVEHSPCCYIIRRIILDGIRFQEGVTMEDYAFCLELYEHCSRIAHLRKPIYNYMIRSGSVSRAKGYQADSAKMQCWRRILQRLTSLPWSDTYRPAAMRWIAHYKLEALKQLGHTCLPTSEKLAIRRSLLPIGTPRAGHEALPSVRSAAMRLMLSYAPTSILLWAVCTARRKMLGR